jgi:hypothetical protein
MSEIPQGLQKQIDALSELCVERQLVINVSKTKVVVFEKHRSARHSSHTEGQPLSGFNHSDTLV